MRIVVVDDDKLVAISLKAILEADNEIEVVGMGYNGEDAISLYEELKPDVLLMDIRMDVMCGLEAGTHILHKNPEVKILYLTTFLDDEYIVKSINIGAKGYILKQDFEGITPAIKAVYGGQSVFGGEIIEKLPELIQSKTKVNYEGLGLLQKEFEIIEYVSKGLSNKEISTELFLSEGTVRNYISGILDKLDLRDRTQLAIYYFNNLK